MKRIAIVWSVCVYVACKPVSPLAMPHLLFSLIKFCSFGFGASFYQSLMNSFKKQKHSGGCSNAVNRVLKKIEGVTNVDCNVEAKSVVVTHDASVTPAFMLEKLQKVSSID
jgi:copper chaperone CopZ